MLSRAVFNKYDTDKSGSVSLQELKQMVYDMGHPMSELQLKNAMSLLDTNGDGSLSYEEFQAWWKQQDRFGTLTEPNPEWLSGIIKHFNHFDKDKSGRISPDEAKGLHANLSSQGFKLPGVDTWVANLDQSGEGQISIKEYVDWMARIFNGGH